MDSPTWLIPVAALAGFAAIWCLVCLLISLFGWRSLAQHFRAQGPFEGPIRRMQSGRVSFANYNNVLTVGADPMGLSLAVMGLFRPGHPPLFIPWHDVVGLRRGRWLLFEYLELQLHATSVKIRLRQATAEFVREAAGSAWPGHAEIASAEAASFE